VRPAQHLVLTEVQAPSLLEQHPGYVAHRDRAGYNTTVHIEQQAGWASEPVWTFLKREKLLSLVRIEGRLQDPNPVGSPCSRW